MRRRTVFWRQLATAPLNTGFNVKCPDGRVRWMVSRMACGFEMSGHPKTRGLWWHELVDWPEIGIGPATWDWSRYSPCRFRGPNGHRCDLPMGHVGYLKLGHRFANGRRFVARVTSYWPMQDPRRAA